MKPNPLVFPYGNPLVGGLIKQQPRDFEVVEELGFEPSGEGEHLFLEIEKTGLTTAQLVDRVARDYALQPRAIGYSGLKDKNAVTTQWLSLHLPGREAPAREAAGDGYRVLRARRHRGKLRRGTHRANFFRVTLREVEALPAATREQIAALRACGMANYFGPQRFGRARDNVEQALAQLGSRQLKPRRRSLLISALRSHLFNQVLSRRIAAGLWDEPLDGDVFMLRGSHSIFSEPPTAELRRRFAELDIAATASLYGDGPERLGGEALRIERRVFDENREIRTCLDRLRVKRQMRALRVVAESFEYDYAAGARCLRLQLRLPAGSYLTSLLGHFIAVTEPDQADF